MTDTAVSSFDIATMTPEHVPPFAQRMREAADLVCTGSRSSVNSARAR